MWAGTPIRLEIQTALFIDNGFYLSLRGWRRILGKPPFVVLPLGYQCFPWVLVTLFNFLTLLFLILLILFILLAPFILLVILILLSLMKVVMMLVLKVLKKLIYKVLCLINLIILNWERHRMGVAIRWQIAHVCMPFVKVIPVQNI
jgi:hypothetical protein